MTMSERKAELVTGDDYGAVITAWTPLETTLVGVHPRLHLTVAGFDRLRANANSGNEPWVAKRAVLLRRADEYAASTPATKAESITGDRRGLGELLCTLSLAWQITRDVKYLDAARTYLRAMVTYPQSIWDAGLTNGHWLYGHAVAYDWLFHDLDDETLKLVRDNLRATVERSVTFLALHNGWMADAYTCNHLPVHMAGVIAAASAVYGETPGCGPFIKFAIEKLNVMASALGPDGLSQESMGYGEYYCAFLLKAFDVARSCLGMDFVRALPWVKNFPASQFYLTLGLKSSANGAIMGFGDSARRHWYGPSMMLRRIASAFRDGHAQGFADECDRLGLSAPCFLDLVWYDPTVPARSLSTLPLMHHFVDKDVVAGRSHWNGDEAVWAFKCGPHFGHIGAMRHPHDIGGGHMQPDTGSLQIAVRDERLLAIDGYFQKETVFNNTVTANGIGHYGDGGEWFEGLQLRQMRRFPRLLSAQTKDRTDVIIGEITPAYRVEAKVQRHIRTLLHQQDLWVMVDELLADPGTLFEAYFHSDYEITEVEGGGGLSWVARGKTARLRMTVMPLQVTTSVTAKVIVQRAVSTSHESKDRPTLVVSSTQSGTEMVRFGVVFQAYDGTNNPPVPKLKTRGSGPFLDAVVSIGPVDLALQATPEETPAK